jgi:hypothetical protein
MNSDLTVTLTDVIWKRQTSLLFVSMLVAACGSSAPARPDIPQSVSPGWKLVSLNKSGMPEGLAPEGAPSCWKAAYTGSGSADVWLCWYRESANAFEAVQRARAAAQTVKFQEGQYFVMVQWNGAQKTELTALVRGIQRALHKS